MYATTTYLVMQLLDGMSLARPVSEAGPLPAPVVCSVGRGIAEALAAAHEAGVLHRDVKPSNVGLTRDGRVVLHDFGLARPADEAVITRTRVVSTPQFMAPEAMRGVLPGPPTDWYGLGACMYPMLTGEVPFATGVEIGAIVEQALDDGVPSLPGRLPSYPEELTRLVDDLRRQDPAERPQQVDTVRSVLGALPDDGTEVLVALLSRRYREQASADGSPVCSRSQATICRPPRSSNTPWTSPSGGVPGFRHTHRGERHLKRAAARRQGS
ncbi:serine/threonine-protein kinase, partial [Streptomyces sp. NPDC001795]|uniref:serine/threonine-protein kinase n=1 Tax=Streptomyces sp. NPDC001795 TaxID=3154525 RepID=UPI00331C8588